MASIFRERDMRSNYPESNCEMNFRLNQPSYLLWRHWIHKHTERSVSSFSRFPLVRFINVIIKFLLSIFDAPALLIFPPRPPTALQLSNSVFLWLALRGGPSRKRLEAIILLLLYDFLSFRNFLSASGNVGQPNGTWIFFLTFFIAGCLRKNGLNHHRHWPGRKRSTNWLSGAFRWGSVTPQH